jgi:hypothetical protein
MTKALVDRGFTLPPRDFFLEILTKYGLQPHNISPNNILSISNHVALCEGHLQIEPNLTMFQYYFFVKKESMPKNNTLSNCGSVTFRIWLNRIYPQNREARVCEVLICQILLCQGHQGSESPK